MTLTFEKARAIFKSRGGTLRTREALAEGIHRRTLYAMRDAGKLIQLARGLYRLAELPPLSEPDLATVAMRIPQGVVCLISALAYHEMTSQIPHEVHLALPRGPVPLVGGAPSQAGVSATSRLPILSRGVRGRHRNAHHR